MPSYRKDDDTSERAAQAQLDNVAGVIRQVGARCPMPDIVFDAGEQFWVNA